MGGRGASSGGRSGRAPNGYRTIGKVGSVKVIRNNRTGKGLPPKAQPGRTYFGTDGSGKVNQMRTYDKFSNAKKDYDWGHIFNGNPANTVHSHSWKNGVRSTEHTRLTPSEIKRIRSQIEKSTGRKDFIW